MAIVLCGMKALFLGDLGRRFDRAPEHEAGADRQSSRRGGEEIRDFFLAKGHRSGMQTAAGGDQNLTSNFSKTSLLRSKSGQRSGQVTI
jgi:hypothetical protein